MWPFHKKSVWTRLTEPVTQNIPSIPSSVVKTGRRAGTTLAGAAAVTLASAAISAVRRKDDSQ